MSTKFLLGGNRPNLNDGGRPGTFSLSKRFVQALLYQHDASNIPGLRHSPVGTGNRRDVDNDDWYDASKIRKRFMRPDDLQALVNHHRSRTEALRSIPWHQPERYYYIDANMIDFEERLAALNAMSAEELCRYYMHHVDGQFTWSEAEPFPKRLWQQWKDGKEIPAAMRLKTIKYIFHSCLAYILYTGPFTGER